MKSYWQLLRVPYQLQLAPIFGWGYLLSGGRLHSREEAVRFLVVFLCFHIGCFGGLTALNSYYDRDRTPVGGLWDPPAPPHRLFAFAWLVQIAGVLPLLWLDVNLAAIYAAIVLMALMYSHPYTRWKGNPFLSLLVVAVGQGVLDYCAGALTVASPDWSTTTWLGMAGATLSVMAFYPLTQLYQIEQDAQRGDRTLARVLIESGGRAQLFNWSIIFVSLAAALNLFAALNRFGFDAILFLGACGEMLNYLENWSVKGEGTARDDFRRVHFLLRVNALAFGIYLLARMIF